MHNAIISKVNIAINIALPCLLSFIFLPKVKQRAAGIKSIDNISNKFEKAVGFSKGWAEFTPKKPPPLVPNCFIATWLAAGPWGTIWLVTLLPSSKTISSSKATSS